jgi:formylglycine-generating enzyme required for sulfatase activity
MIQSRVWHAFAVASVLTFAASGWQLADAPRPVGAEPRFLPWVDLKAGAFQMGCVPEDRSCSSNELPRHEVTITPAFSMTATPITVAQYRAYADATGVRMPRQPAWSGDSHPVVETTWPEADAYYGWQMAACRQKRNGSTQHAAARPEPSTHGVTTSEKRASTQAGMMAAIARKPCR